MKPLNNERPLLIQPKLAKIIGINECIVLSQLHYWIELNKERNINYYDGRYWTYHTIEKWLDQFPFKSEKTLRNIFKRLEEQKLIKTGNFNKLKYDRTKWYTILYENLPDVGDIPQDDEDMSPNGEIHSPISRNISGNIYQLNKEDNTDTIQENKIRNINKNDNGSFQHPYENKDIIDEFIIFYYKCFFKRTGRKHPRLKEAQLNRIYEYLDDFISDNDLELEDLIEMAVQFFNSNIATDFNLNHFATKGILKNRFWEVLY